jgi:uncharacterized protein YigE (DUF2233 family)
MSLRPFALCLGIALSLSVLAQHVACEKGKLAGAWFFIVTVDLNSENVKVTGAVAQPRGRAESFGSLIRRTQPTVAICGTFFDLKTKTPVADIVIEGHQHAEGHRGSALVIDYYNRPKILDFKPGQPVDWTLYRFGLRGGIRILTAGKTTINPTSQGFKDKRIWGRARRTAVGLKPGNKLVFLLTKEPVHLSQLAEAMKVLNVRDAVAFDGGGSTALYYKGSTLIAPNRPLTNVVLVYEKRGAAWWTFTP